MTRFIAFDLGLNFGWFDGEIGGSIRVDDKVRYKSFHYHVNILLTEGLIKGGAYDTIVYEDAAFQKGRAIYNFNAQKGILQCIAELTDLDFIGYSPITIKKAFTGNARASKEDMIAACKKMGHETDDHNHADAIAAWYTHNSKVRDESDN